MISQYVGYTWISLMVEQISLLIYKNKLWQREGKFCHQFYQVRLRSQDPFSRIELIHYAAHLD